MDGDSVSLTGFGPISTFETDYNWEVIQHSISDISKRQKDPPDACTYFYLLEIFVHEILIESKGSLYLVVSTTTLWLYDGLFNQTNYKMKSTVTCCDNHLAKVDSIIMWGNKLFLQVKMEAPLLYGSFHPQEAGREALK